jgi:ribosome recycling factor
VRLTMGESNGEQRTFLMTPDDILLETEAAMEKGVEYMLHEFAAVRTGKASPALVENLDVEAYGTSMKLKQLALISTPEPRLLLIQPFDASVTKDIERALKESKIGITPAVDGKLIRLPIPELSEERRKDLVKTVRHMAEEARVRLRSSRRAGINEVKKIEKAGAITEDERHDLEDEIQKLTDKYVKDVDSHAETKEVDIMRV